MLLFVHLFNLGGYHAYFNFFINRSNQDLIQQLDNNQFHDRDLVEVKIPLSLPYTNDWADYERIDGEIEFNGTFYNYVKRKLSRDTLYLMCLRNSDKTELNVARYDYGKQVNDFPANKNSSSPLLKKGIPVIEYNQVFTTYTLPAPGVMQKPEVPPFASVLVTSYIDENFHPPQRLFYATI